MFLEISIYHLHNVINLFVLFVRFVFVYHFTVPFSKYSARLVRTIGWGLPFGTHRVVEEILVGQADAVFKFCLISPTKLCSFRYIQQFAVFPMPTLCVLPTSKVCLVQIILMP